MNTAHTLAFVLFLALTDDAISGGENAIASPPQPRLPSVEASPTAAAVVVPPSPSAPAADTDGDGFTDLEEKLGKTDPNDTTSHPPYYTKLFLSNHQGTFFPVLFAARNGQTVLLNNLDNPPGPGRTQFLKVGDRIAGTSFKITELAVKAARRSGIVRDATELVITSVVTGQSFVLSKDMDSDHPTAFATLSYAWSGNDFTVQEGIGFNLPPETKVFYRVIKLESDRVKLVKLDDGTKITIHKIAEGGI